MNYIYLICLIGLYIGVYYLGKCDGSAAASTLDEEAQYDLEVYKIDKFYEHQRWVHERKVNHE